MGECGLVAAFNKIFFSHKKLVSGCNKTHYAAPSGIERAQNSKTHGTSHRSAQISSGLTNFQSFLTKLRYLGKSANCKEFCREGIPYQSLAFLAFAKRRIFGQSKHFIF